MCYIQNMSYRTIKVCWTPKSRTAWQVFTAVRLEAGKLWSDLVERHHAARVANTKWPSKADLQKELKGQYPNLHSQSIQQLIADFCEAVESARQLRKTNPDARYPWRKPRYHAVIFTNQGAKIADKVLRLPCGNAGKLLIRLPESVELPGRLMEVRLHFGEVELVCEVPDQPIEQGVTIGIDLGVNTLLAATDGHKSILVSGRAVKSTIQWRNKRLAELSTVQSKKVKGSRRWQRLQRRKKRMIAKTKRRVSDLLHKASRKVAQAFPQAKAYVGEPFNDAAQKTNRTVSQQVSQCCTRKLINLLDYKLSGAITVPEHYSSQTCPVCGARSKHRRVYRCQCGVKAPRDVIGSLNILNIGMTGSLQIGCQVPNLMHWVHPTKYSGHCPDSSSGHLASSSMALAVEKPPSL
jgi:putative transposase